MSFQDWIKNCLVPVMINTEKSFQIDADCSLFKSEKCSKFGANQMVSSIHQLQNSPERISNISYIFLFVLNMLSANLNVP